MSRSMRLTLLVLSGLGVLALVTSLVVGRTLYEWFEREAALRAELALNGARGGLVEGWTDDPSRVRALLSQLTRDERLVAATACGLDLQPVARTASWPDSLTCETIGRLLDAGGQGPQAWAAWGMRARLHGDPAHVVALPVVDGGEPIGFVSMLHDMSFVERRRASTRRFLLLSFGVLAGSALLLTIYGTRLSWRGWTNEIRDVLQGGSHRKEFQPILQDLRALIDRLTAEHEVEGDGAAWTPQRLKDTLRRYLLGERIVVVANREPYIHDRAADGSIEARRPASGLVTALEPVLRACSGVWVAHGSGTADRDVVDRHARVRVPPGEESYVLRRVWLSAEEETGYYYGFANEGLWPLCHLAHTRPRFRAADWAHYRRVNQRFADAACQEVDADDAIILVQDYHFGLAPRMIRERLPRATILTFWHVPWPTSERFSICPWTEELLDGMLGSSILGFHTRSHCNNFLDSVDRFLESRLDREQHAVTLRGGSTLVRPYPISIAWPNHWAAESPPVDECRAEVRLALGLAPDALLGVGVDRLDYTKGIEERLLAVERLLERHPEYVGVFTFAQLAAPSRTAIDEYRLLHERVEALAARVNARFGRGDYRPIVLLQSHHEPATVFRYYRAADLCYVSSLHDGMNLVAKEFVAARDDEGGVLVLSHLTGAARELTDALIVNPYDLDEAGAALAAALAMPRDEQRARMRAMRAIVAEFNVYRWAGRMVLDAERLRRSERMSGRFAEHRRRAGVGV